MTIKRIAIPSKEAQLFIVGDKGPFKASRIQRLSLNTDIPSTTVDELGDSSHVGDSRDIPNVTLTFSAMDVGVKIFQAMTGSVNPYPVGGVDISQLGEMDAIVYIKSDVASTYIKAAHARRLQIRDFTFNYTVDGESTEDYTAVGSEKRWFSKDIVVNTVTTSPGTAVTLTQGTPSVLKNGHYLLSLIVDGIWFDEVTGTPSDGQYSISGTSVTLGTAFVTQVVAVYQVNTNTGVWTDVGDSTMPIAIRGKDVKVTIAANSIPRIQSISVNGTMNVQPVKEMGNRFILGYQRQVPDVTGTITVMDTDNELISLFQNGVTASGTEYAPGEGCVSSGIKLKIDLIDPCDIVAPYDVKKTIYLDNIIVTSDAFSSTVNQNATMTFNFKSTTAHAVVYSGSTCPF
jgi:hypothetical protein